MLSAALHPRPSPTSDLDTFDHASSRPQVEIPTPGRPQAGRYRRRYAGRLWRGRCAAAPAQPVRLRQWARPWH